jgi:C1A family cysteine protease
VADRKYGMLPSKPDDRDFKYKTVRLTVARKMDLRPYCSPVRDQGNLGSCTGQAGAAMREYYEILLKSQQISLSPLMLYYLERWLEGNVNIDIGAEPRNAMRALLHIGIAPEELYITDPAEYKHAPNFQALMEARKFRISSYERLQNVEQMLTAINDRQPVLMGVMVYPSFENVDATGVVRLPDMMATCLGGHAILAVGYDQDAEWFIVKNSWGSAWGHHGYCYLPFGYVTPQHCTDLWVGAIT